jgi:hypothetical protein
MKALYKPIPDLDSISFTVEKQEDKSFEYPWHYHPEYELTYILNNPGVRYVERPGSTWAQPATLLGKS